MKRENVVCGVYPIHIGYDCQEDIYEIELNGLDHLRGKGRTLAEAFSRLGILLEDTDCSIKDIMDIRLVAADLPPLAAWEHGI